MIGVDHRRRGIARALGEWVIDQPGEHDADQPRDVGAAEHVRDGAGVHLLGEERDLGENAGGVASQCGEVPCSVSTVDVVQRRNVDAFLGDQVVVDQIDRTPRREHHQQHQDEVLEVVQEVGAGGDGDQDRDRSETEDVEGARGARDSRLSVEGGDGGQDRHESAVGVEHVHRQLADQDDEVDQEGDGSGSGQISHEADLVTQERVAGAGRDESAEGHGPLRSDDTTEERRPERGALGSAARQVTRVVGDVRAEGELPTGTQRDREQEGDYVEALDADVRGDVVLEEQSNGQVGESDDAHDGGDPADDVDQLVAGDRDECGEETEDDDADGGAVDVQDLVDGLSGQHGAGGSEAEVHQDDENKRYDCSLDAELGATRDHLGETHTRALCGVKRHDSATEDVADQKSDDRPDGVRAEYDGESAVDDCSDLHVGAEPESELAARGAVSFCIRDDVDSASFRSEDDLGRSIVSHRPVFLLRARRATESTSGYCPPSSCLVLCALCFVRWVTVTADKCICLYIQASIPGTRFRVNAV